MTKILLVRHGKAAATWTDDLDPGLDDLGHSQAESVTAELESLMKDLRGVQLLASPLRRTRETSTPTAQLWRKPVTIEPRVAEIPSPGLSLEDRGAWLHSVMADRWSHLSQELQQWRQQLIDCVCDIQNDSVIFTHFIAINVISGWLNNDDRVVNFMPDNCSITELVQTQSDGLELVKLGKEAGTKVN